MIKFSNIKIFYALLPIIGCWLLAAGCVNAAVLYFSPLESEVAVGDTFFVEVRLDTENKDINAVDAGLSFSSDNFEFKDFSDGGSVISLWMERPKLDDGELSFSGLMPGGFRGKGLLLKLILEAKREGVGEVTFGDDSQVLLNDGKGTKASLSISNFQFPISKQIQNSKSQILKTDDIEPPELFEPKIVRLDNVFDGKWFIVFSTQDKDSGVDYYEVFDGGEWVRAESPYVLKNQNFKKDLRVKAVDKAGNERIAVVEPRYPVKWYEIWWIWDIIILGVFLGYIIWKIKRRKLFSA